MHIEEVNKVVVVTSALGDLVKAINPEGEADWEVLEKLMIAHRTLRKINLDALRQLPLDIKE